MFKLDDIVATKRAGPPAVGIIAGCYNGDFYNWQQNENIKRIKYAKKREYGEDGNYYTVCFSDPIKVMTVQELMEDFNWKYKEAQEYWDGMPYVKYLDYPESELQLFDSCFA